MPHPITPAILNKANEVEHDLQALDVSTRALLHLLRAGHGPGGPAPFVPTDIAGLRLWLDASDTTTITHSGGSVSAWTSKDANARAFNQSSSGLRPTTGAATQNGLNVITFAADALVSTAASSVWKFLHDGAKYSMFLVFRPGATANPGVDYALLVTGSGGGSSGISLLWQDNGVNERMYHIVNNTATPRAVLNQSGDGFAPANTFQIARVTADPANATAADRSSMRRNAGTAVANNTQTGTPSASNPSQTLSLGDTGFGWTGAFAEVIVYESDLATPEVEAVEAYLAAKWGITI
jgi:hypothetical protein